MALFYFTFDGEPLPEFSGTKLIDYTGGAIDLRALGVSPVSMPYSEYYVALERGVVDGVAGASRSDLESLATAMGLATTVLEEPGVMQQPTANDDALEGDAAANLIDGLAGSDTILGRAGEDTLVGGGGHDRLIGGAGADVLEGGPGNDLLNGEETEGEFDGIAWQVVRFYQATLDRAPDQRGHSAWTDRLERGSMTPDEVADSFVRSREFQNTYGDTSNTQFVTLLYNNVLDRDPDSGGLANWTDRLESGAMTRAQVVRGFSDSQEFMNDTEASALAFSRAGSQAGYADDVFRLYQATLDRAPDIGGFLSWTRALAEGTPLQQTAQGFVGSREFERNYGDSTNGEFVTLLYNNVLDRDPDAKGLANWTGQLNSNARTRSEVVVAFSQSQEFRNQTEAPLEAWLRGLGEDDRLEAGSGNDVLFGGIGADRFVFEAADQGDHVVADLEAWDTVEFADFGYADRLDAVSRMTQVADDLVFSDQGVTIRFLDTARDEVSARMLEFSGASTPAPNPEPEPEPEPEPPSPDTTPAVIFDLGGKFDKSYNEAAFNGAERWANESGGSYREFELQSDAQREQALMRFAERGMEPVVSIGSASASALDTVAKLFPDTSFAILGAEVEQPNVAAYTFAGHESAYVMGVIAAVASESDTVGFIGGMDSPLARRFSTAFEQGVNATESDTEVLINMAGTTPAAWNDPVRGAELANAQMQQGADVIYTTAGGTSIGVLQAVADAGQLAIGQDTDLTYLHPGNVLTAAVNNIDDLIFRVFSEGADLEAGVYELGFAEGGLSYADGEHNQSVMTDEIRLAADSAIAAIIDGSVVVTDYLDMI